MFGHLSDAPLMQGATEVSPFPGLSNDPLRFEAYDSAAARWLPLNYSWHRDFAYVRRVYK
jgi:hypothetical protein